MSPSVLHNASDRGSSKKSRGISRSGRADGAALALSGVGETSPHVVARQLREIGYNLRFRHTARQIVEDIANRIRVPRTHGFPDRMAGSAAIRSSKFILAVYSVDYRLQSSTCGPNISAYPRPWGSARVGALSLLSGVLPERFVGSCPH
jgi:hypothetical protein